MGEEYPDTVVYERYVKDMNGNIKGDKIDAKVRALQKQEKSEKNKAKAAALAKQIKVLQAESNEVDILTSFHLDHGNGLILIAWALPWDWVHQASW